MTARQPVAGLRQLAPVSKVDQVQRAVLEGIFQGVFQPGARLIETALASQLNVSQATVNQALQELDAQGIVNKSPNRETTVCLFERADAEAILSLRLVLERMAAEAVARRRDPQALGGLRRQVERMRAAARADDMPEFLMADFEFHSELYRLSENRFLVQACKAIVAAPFVNLLCERLDDGPIDNLRTAREHEQIVDALGRGPQAAARVVRARLAEWHRAALSALAARPRDSKGAERTAPTPQEHTVKDAHPAAAGRRSRRARPPKDSRPALFGGE